MTLQLGTVELIMNQTSAGIYAFVEVKDPTDPEQRKGQSVKHFHRLDPSKKMVSLDVFRALYFDAIVVLSNKPSKHCISRY